MRILFLIIVAFLFKDGISQTTLSKTIQHNGLTREYRLYVPAIYNSNNAVPLVLNLHGYTSNNLQQEAYGDFRTIADTANFIIAHPNGTYDQYGYRYWNSFSTPGFGIDDFGFLSALIDSISQDYNIDANSVYSTGMSNGGFMSYDLACGLGNKIAAIASVTGSMVYSHKSSCIPSHPVPVMQIHGTADGTVSYSGSATFVPIDTLVKFWAKFNNTSLTPVITAVPNTNTTDNSTADHYVYGGGDMGSSVEFFKVYNGGHSWPGAPVNVNVTNMDFNASVEIWRFFRKYKLSNLVTSVKPVDSKLENVKVFPNPFADKLTIESTSFIEEITIYSVLGNKIISEKCNSTNQEINACDLKPGIYLIKVATEKGITCLNLLK